MTTQTSTPDNQARYTLHAEKTWFYFQKLDIEFGQELIDLIDYYTPIVKTIEPGSMFNIVGAFIEEDFFPKYFNGSEVSSVCSIVAPRNSVGTIHSDTMIVDAATGQAACLALQIPLWGTENTDTIFWESSDSKPTIRKTTEGSPGRHNKKINSMVEEMDTPGYLIPKRYLCKEVARCSITSPYLINVGQYHSIANHNETQRAVLSVRFKSDPWHWLT